MRREQDCTGKGESERNFLFSVKIQKLKDSILYNVNIGIELTVSDKYLSWL